MKARRIECAAVFHDRKRMEEAVRGLLDNGMPPKCIRISQESVRGKSDRRPNLGSLLALGVAIGSVTGAALTLVWILWLSGLVAPPLPLIVHRTADAAFSGGLVGALFAVVVSAAHHRDRYEVEPKADFLVAVAPPDAAIADDVRGVLTFRGGDLLASRNGTRTSAIPHLEGYRLSSASRSALG